MAWIIHLDLVAVRDEVSLMVFGAPRPKLLHAARGRDVDRQARAARVGAGRRVFHPQPASDHPVLRRVRGERATGRRVDGRDGGQ